MDRYYCFWKFIFPFASNNFSFKESIEILYVFGSISTKSISPPQYITQFAEATNDIGEVQTISPFFIPIDKQAKCRALVALTDATAYLALQKIVIPFQIME